MLIKTLDKQDTFLIKGIAILSILLHNFFHWIAPFTGENEFDFYRNRKRGEPVGSQNGEGNHSQKLP